MIEMVASKRSNRFTKLQPSTFKMVRPQSTATTFNIKSFEVGSFETPNTLTDNEIN